MTHKLIKTDKYLLVVDDFVKEVNRGEYYLLGYEHVNQWASADTRFMTGLSSKIIAHLPLNGSPILEGVDLLPPLEDDVEQLAKKEIEYNKHNKHFIYEMIVDSGINGFIKGYNKAREKYKYTEEDVRKALSMAKWGVNNGNYQNYTTNEIIQSLHQYPTEFECEMKYFEVDMGLGEECIEHGQIPQKITTTQGTQWVGKYK